jgi:penicillin G amidase
VFLMRRIVLGALAVATIAIGVLVVGVLWLRSSLPITQGVITVTGLQDTVSIERDAYGVPHIRAVSLNDAYFGLGFAHAQDRLFQMEVFRRVTQGRLAELLGPKSLGTDKLIRTLRTNSPATSAVSAEAEASIAAYVAGVNAFLGTRTGALPPEFVALGAAPAAWTIEDTKQLWMLGLVDPANWRDELWRAGLQDVLTEDERKDLYPATPVDAPITHPDFRLTNMAVKHGNADRPTLPRLPFSDLAKAFDDILPAESLLPASNIWIVSGAHTKSGKPLLANDPHGMLTSLATPHYLAELRGPGFELAGMTLPGAPFFGMGHNARIAWGMTNAAVDQADIFVERLSADGGGYETPDGVAPFRTRREVIKVKGAEDVVLEVRETRHGPVISDLDPAARAVAAKMGEGYVLALAGASITEGNRAPRAIEAMLRVGVAADWCGFVSALRGYEATSNIGYADSDGNIGMVTAARVPLRKKGDGFMPVPGWSGEYDWLGYVPYDELPRSYNPSQGFLVNANSRLADDSYPYPMSLEFPGYFRSRRIQDLVVQRTDHTIESMAAIQADTTSLGARMLLPVLRSTLVRDDFAQQALALLRAWDGNSSADRVEPLIFNAWLGELYRAILGPKLAGAAPSYLARRPDIRFLHDVLTQKTGWCGGAEACARMQAATLESALHTLRAEHGDEIAKWRWGAVHTARIDHGFFADWPFADLFANAAIESGGDTTTVNVGAFRLYGPRPFEQTTGALNREIFDLSDLSKSRFMVVPGESFNVLSPHLRDLLPMWRDVESISFGGEAASRSKLILMPMKGIE